MKKNFTLLLAFVMLVSSMLAIMPAADETAGGGSTVESYEPTIAYSNVNSSEDLILMFAVPAPAQGEIDAQSTVKLVLWTSPSLSYSYKDTIAPDGGFAAAVALDAEADLVTIGGVEHLVYKYCELDASKMTDIVYARAVVVDKDGKATAYSDVLDYSVVEYAETAKGSFNDGTPIVSDDVVELIDSLLNFGAVVQELANDGEGHIPNGYLANEELHKIWITPVVAGETKEKVFGGFFKYDEGVYATVRAPFYDGYSVIKYRDTQGNELTDADPAEYDEAFGFQMDAVDGDIEVFVEYEYAAIREVCASEFGEGYSLNNIEQGVINGNPTVLTEIGASYPTTSYIAILKNGTSGVNFNMSGQAGELSGASKNYYAGFKTIPDPEKPDNLVIQITATDIPTFGMTNYISPNELAIKGYGDTLDGALTIEVELGRSSPDAKVNTFALVLYNRSSWNKSDGHKTAECYFNLFKIQNNNVIVHGDSTKICTLPETGFVKVAITINAEGEYKAYYSNADGEMVLALVKDAEKLASKEYKDKHAKYLANLEDDDPTNDDTYALYKDVGTYISQNTFQPVWTVGRNLKVNEAFESATVDIDGNQTPIKNPNGGFNYNALQRYAEQNYSFLLRQWKIYIGDIYE